jgi:hypothetical protein
MLHTIDHLYDNRIVLTTNAKTINPVTKYVV